jgi:hypothetical protein
MLMAEAACSSWADHSEPIVLTTRRAAICTGFDGELETLVPAYAASVPRLKIPRLCSGHNAAYACLHAFT